MRAHARIAGVRAHAPTPAVPIVTMGPHALEPYTISARARAHAPAPRLTNRAHNRVTGPVSSKPCSRARQGPPGPRPSAPGFRALDPRGTAHGPKKGLPRGHADGATDHCPRRARAVEGRGSSEGGAWRWREASIYQVHNINCKPSRARGQGKSVFAEL